MQGEKPRQRKLRLAQAPYTYARISVMKSKLLRKDDYNKLMKMKLNDIVKFLQESDYRKEIDEMTVNYSGIELVELALNKNLVKTFQKLKRIAEYPDLRAIMEKYMEMADVWNIKTILRGKFMGEKDERIKDLMMPIGKFDERFFDELIKKDSIEDIIKSLKFLSKEQINDAMNMFKETKSLFAVENMLDANYYSGSAAFADSIPKQGVNFMEFMQGGIDITNIKTLLRLKKEGIDKEDIEGFLIINGARIHKAMLSKLARAESLDSLISMLQKIDIGYGKSFREIFDSYDRSKKDITKIELKLNKFLLDRAIMLLHMHPLSIDVILGYMFAKDIEIKNLRTIIKGRQLGLKDEFIESELVISG